MKARFLKPGQAVTIHGRQMVFVQRLRQGREVAGRTTNVFTCADYVGLNGHQDDGRCTLSDQMFAVLSKEGGSRD
jgi:hypothetical protein